jgi:hypothetical protein
MSAAVDPWLPKDQPSTEEMKEEEQRARAQRASERERQTLEGGSGYGQAPLGQENFFSKMIQGGVPRQSPEDERDAMERAQVQQDITDRFRRPEYNAIQDSMRRADPSNVDVYGARGAGAIYQNQMRTRDADLDSALVQNRRQLNTNRQAQTDFQDGSTYGGLVDSLRRQEGMEARPAGMEASRLYAQRRDEHDDERERAFRERQMLMDQKYSPNPSLNRSDRTIRSQR